MKFFRSGRCVIFVLCLSVLLAASVYSEDSVDGNPAAHRSEALIVSPLIGWVTDDSNTAGTDTSPEYGLFMMYASPRLVINNTTFFSDVNQSDVWGNIASVNLYGDPKKKLTWYLGGSYIWHKVESDNVNVSINEPLGKVGVIWRIPDLHLSVTPYIGYGQMTVRTKGSVMTPGGPITFSVKDRSDIVVAGVSSYWRWRMLHANAKYYMSEDLDHDTLNHNFRVWCSAMFNERVGVIARLEYEEQNSGDTTSWLFGPVFVF
jgi:hypothetical protein